MGLGKIARRSFLIGTAALGAGVAFGVYSYRREGENPLRAGLAPDAAALTPYVLLDPEGVTLITPRADVGQGAASVQAHLLAEELDVDPAEVRLSPGPASPVYHNGKVAAEGMPLAAWDDGFAARTGRAASEVAGKLMGLHLTGGSTTVPDMYDRLRAAGASARETLKAAAAARLGVPAETLRTEGGRVIWAEGALPYAELIPALAEVEVVQDVPLRDPSDWRHLGRPHRRVDIVAKSVGTFRYGGDLVLEDMVHATVVTNPTRGGGVVSMDASEAEAMRGVEAVLPITDGAAVLADNDWRAFKAARALRFEWGGAGPRDDSLLEMHAAALDGDRDSAFTDEGDVDAAPGKRIEAEYRVPFLHHAPLEPATATVRYTPEATEIWVATQAPIFVAEAVARLTGQDREQVTVHVLPAGGSFGHRLEHEWVEQATEIARQVPGRPIRLMLSREQDMTHGFYRPMAMARGRGTVETGQVRSLDLAVAAQSVAESQLGRLGYPALGPDVAIVAGAWDAPYTLPDRRITGHRVPATVPVSSWRSVGASHNGFFLESLMDELIHEAGADPVEERLRLLSHAPSRRVLETVAEMASWNGPEGKRGVAFAFSFGVPVAQIMEVRETSQGIVMDRLWIAAELGRVLDPVNAEAQLSGGALFGIGHAIAAEITFGGAGPEQQNFDTYESLRLWQVPQVEVRALGSGGSIRGVGEPGLPPAAPALANAIFAATGTRLRRMPFSAEMRFA
ncbi:xanthine dehydrogenase family protein molybdopterin-binding subunit [Jannaschia seohaensis]|uniref:Isoquinoline 1-oxidoreductase beta subunit n=1 Tax=Jannaschia seohaensis TaxID=475081 RepID=A0A2Y9AGY3_9RHOB|nr:molybdopterin cofactor-binding domain-containing protein [Jannaschia seohaensis]PWJ21217.1 isoquinoline 1-oxidoreductase beta subunit [Jannaschia seohaensis]SSA41627.1 isoquinoline 1-oxidoreductase, beta subunit [Jannaschia seohaensis]